jgi:hypothetical protein
MHQIDCGVGYSIKHYLVVASAMLGSNVEAPKPKNIEVPKPKIDMKRSPFFVLLAPNISWNINNASSSAAGKLVCLPSFVIRIKINYQHQHIL